MIATECTFHKGKVDFLLPNIHSCASNILWRQIMNDRMNTFKLVERGTGRQDKASAREGIQGQDDDNAVVFMSHTRCSWVSLEKEMTPFLTEWKVLLSFHISPTVSDRGCPQSQAFRSLSQKLSLSCQLGDCGWFSPWDLFCIKQENTNKHKCHCPEQRKFFECFLLQ